MQASAELALTDAEHAALEERHPFNVVITDPLAFKEGPVRRQIALLLRRILLQARLAC